MTPIECGNIIKEELKRCALICKKEFGWGPFPLEVKYNVRGTVAGRAFMDKRIRFNLLLLMEQHADQVRMVAAHEFAHIATFKKWSQEVVTKFRSTLTSEISFDEVALLQDEDLVGSWPNHGPEWRRMMLLFGYPPKRCHSFDVTRHRLR